MAELDDHGFEAAWADELNIRRETDAVPDEKLTAARFWIKGRQSVIVVVAPAFLKGAVYEHQGTHYFLTTPRQIHEIREALGLNH
jgi:hypothetical protein